MATKNSRVVTGKVRLSYVYAFQPQVKQDGSTGKYGVAILIPKTDKETIAKINKAFEEAKTNSAAYFGGTVPKLLKGGLRDGDLEKEEAEYAGCMFINANSSKRPGVVDAEMQPILDPDELYSGCYGRVAIEFYPYQVEGSKGIACGLGNIQKLEDGERLGGGGVSAAVDFAV
jgi:hypothetical protein